MSERDAYSKGLAGLVLIRTLSEPLSSKKPFLQAGQAGLEEQLVDSMDQPRVLAASRSSAPSSTSGKWQAT